MIEIPEVVRNRAISEGHAAWIEELPQLIRSLERDWDIEVGAQFDGGTEAFVATARRVDGTPAVLKVLVPRRGGGIDDREAAVLRLTNGDGCPALYRDDPDRGALLMEQLGPSLFALGVPYAKRLPILCDAASRIWRPASEAGLPTGAAKAGWLIEFIASTWTELDEPCAGRTIDHATACAERRRAAHDDERSVLVHGDVQQWNALQAVDGYKLVDPDGLLAEAEYDLGVVLREDPDEPLGADTMATARWMADHCGLDAVAIWEWGVIERVSTGLVATKIGLQPVGRQMLDLADRIAVGP